MDVQRQIRQRPPEVVRSVAGAAETLVEDVDGAVDHDVARQGAEPRDLRVVADLEVERIGGGPVGAGLEEDRRALGAELIRDLLRRRSRRAWTGSSPEASSGRGRRRCCRDSAARARWPVRRTPSRLPGRRRYRQRQVPRRRTSASRRMRCSSSRSPSIRSTAAPGEYSAALTGVSGRAARPRASARRSRTARRPPGRRGPACPASR